METKYSKIFLGFVSITVILFVIATALAIAIFSPVSEAKEERYIYITEESTVESVRQDVGESYLFDILSYALDYHVKTGRYIVRPEQSWFSVMKNLRNGTQEPVSIVLPSVRTMKDLAGFLGRKLMADSTAWTNILLNDERLKMYNYNTQTVAALFIPNTYEVWWDTDPDDFILRMIKEHDTFWNDTRLEQAKKLKMTPLEVSVLASIIDEETANNAEKPRVAGMYLNRLRIGMPLQADPTVKFAVGDFTLKRIYHEHLAVQSPYNTYLNTGLPPGPIRIASIASINAVLKAEYHNYLYMCANPDFSGTHIFAENYNAHLNNAHRYAQALNARGIK